MNQHPICFKRQYDNIVQLYVNIFKEGYTMLAIYPEKNPLNVNVIIITSPDVSVELPTEEGVYIFQAVNINKSISTNPMSLYLDYVNTEEEIAAILKYVPDLNVDDNWAKKIMNLIKITYNKDKTKSLVEAIKEVYFSIDDILPKQEEFIFKFMTATEYYLNTKNISMNNTNENTKLLYGAELTFVSDNINVQLLTYKNINGKRKLINKYKNYDINGTKITPTFGTNLLYTLVVKSNNDIINWFYHYKFEDKFQSLLWNKSQEKENQNADITYTRIMTEVSSVDFSDEEAAILKIEIAHKPHDYYFNRPIVKNENDYDEIEFYIPDYDAIKASKKKYYISSKEEDLLEDNFSGRREVISDYRIKLNKSKHYLGGNTFFYIENENGIQVSPLTRYDFDSDIEDYNEKVKIYEFDVYKKRLIESIRLYAPYAENFISEEIDRIKNDSDSNPDKANIELMNAVLSYYKDKNELDFIFFAIMEDWNKHFTLDSNFFNAAVQYSYSEDKIFIPDAFTSNRNYILVVHYLTLDDIEFQTEYASAGSSAIELTTKDSELIILYAIDMKKGVRSGFLLFDNEDSLNPFILKSNLEYERR